MKPYTATIEVRYFADNQKDATRKAKHINTRITERINCVESSAAIQVRDKAGKVIFGIESYKPNK